MDSADCIDSSRVVLVDAWPTLEQQLALVMHSDYPSALTRVFEP